MGRQGNSGTNGSRPKGSGSGQTARGPARKPARKPVNPVFRRRRLVVGGVLLLVIVIAVGGFMAMASIINGGGSSGGGPAPDATSTTAGDQAPGPVQSSATATAAADASATPSATPSEGAGCQQNLIAVTADTDKQSYGAADKPLLTLKVTNNNKVPCEVNIGTSQMEFLITSGSDRIFSSQDCQADSTDLMKTIAPGKSETANFPWQRNRTVQGCDSVEAKPGAGGAYYVFTARLANKMSPKAVFQLN
jgi:hypothetical protein